MDGLLDAGGCLESQFGEESSSLSLCNKLDGAQASFCVKYAPPPPRIALDAHPLTGSSVNSSRVSNPVDVGPLSDDARLTVDVSV